MRITGSLLFDWPRRSPLSLGLPLALGLSALAHAAILALFGLKEPAAAGRLLRPENVDFLPAYWEPGRALLARASMCDPALFSPFAPEDTLETQMPQSYQPSFSQWKPRLAPPPPFSPARAPVALLRPVGWPRHQAVSPEISPSEPKEPLPPFQVWPGGGLAGSGFVPGKLPDWQPGDLALRLQAGEPRSSEWLVGVEPGGHVRHAVLLRSSGDEQLDEWAGVILRRGRFEPPPGAEVWSTAGLDWRLLPANTKP